MTYGILGFILGFLACAALCWKRLRELKQSRDAAIEQNEMLWNRDRRRQEGVSNIFARASEIRNILGGKALLPATAETQDGQRVSLRTTAKLTGPSVDGGPDFSGRHQ